jgi:hypothetical protein
MPNHFHLLIKQNSNIGIDRLISKLCTSFSSFINRKYLRVGHLFQDAFKSKEVDNDSYLVHLSAYIHRNPTDPLSYHYSSFQEYMGEVTAPVCDKEPILQYFANNVREYQKFVLESRSSDSLVQGLLFEE